MKIQLTSVMVDDQQKGLAFYTSILGFVKRADIPMGEYRWITVVSPDGSKSVELLLEPNANPAARTFQKAMYDAGVPAAMFAVSDIQQEYKRMKILGVTFRSAPATMGPVIAAVLDDTCGNLIQLYQEVPQGA